MDFKLCPWCKAASNDIELLRTNGMEPTLCNTVGFITIIVVENRNIGSI